MMKETSKGRILLTIMKAFFIIFLLLILVLIGFVIRSSSEKKKQEKINQEYRQNYPKEIQNYLMDKYGESFNINFNYHYYTGSPIPSSNSKTPYMFEVKEIEKGGYLFNVRIITESDTDDKIYEISDNYSWKFLTIKTKEWFETKLTDNLPEEYKFIMYVSDFYDKSIDKDTPLEYYFESRSVPVRVTIHLVIPQGSITQDAGLTEELVEKVVNDFHTSYPNSRILFYILQTKAIHDYQLIDIQEYENSRFCLYQDSKNIWNIVETVMKIEVSETR